MFPNLHVVTIRRYEDRLEACRQRLAAEGIVGFTPVYGIDGKQWGLHTEHVYDVDHPGEIPPYHISQGNVGIVLTWYMMWREFQVMIGDEFTVMEDDCVLRPGWQEAYKTAREHLPDDWDILLLGHCCAHDKPARHVGGNLYEVFYPSCNHLQIYRKKALETLIRDNEKAWAPLDLAMVLQPGRTLHKPEGGTYRKLRVYSALPRIADQENTVLVD